MNLLGSWFFTTRRPTYPARGRYKSRPYHRVASRRARGKRGSANG